MVELIEIIKSSVKKVGLVHHVKKKLVSKIVVKMVYVKTENAIVTKDLQENTVI